MSTTRATLGAVLGTRDLRDQLSSSQGNWREIDMPDHGGSILVVWGMEDDVRAGKNSVECEARANRLVACWNACEGISTEALESDGNAALGWLRTASKLIRATAERDKLLALLEELVEDFGYSDYISDEEKERDGRIVAARAAIAEVTGGKA